MTVTVVRLKTQTTNQPFSLSGHVRVGQYVPVPFSTLVHAQVLRALLGEKLLFHVPCFYRTFRTDHDPGQVEDDVGLSTTDRGAEKQVCQSHRAITDIGVVLVVFLLPFVVVAKATPGGPQPFFGYDPAPTPSNGPVSSYSSISSLARAYKPPHFIESRKSIQPSASARNDLSYVPGPSYKAVTSYKPVYSYKVPPKYSFNWAIKDDFSNSDFGHEETRDGDHTRGSYSVLLPDGRLQTVRYYVDGDSGYVAEVSYKGQARYPVPKPAYKPVYKPAYNPVPAYNPNYIYA
ncbi:uncharacterized protein [Panulirus ornatus]|uniref:uncharacterized protein n=1 Tax=Panulirus ornatus TaxID=150431 RepID=UPI003A8AF0AA